MATAGLKKDTSLKVLFIRTTSPTDVSFVPPLGVIHLAAVIRDKYPDALIRVVDYALGSYTPHRLAQMAKQFNPDIIGLSSMTHEFHIFRNLVDDMRKTCPKSLYLAGGPLATHNYKEIFEHCQLDFAIRCEGEITMMQLIEAHRSGTNPYDINGIVYKKNGELQVNPEQAFIGELDSLPVPAWDLVDLKKYSTIANWNGVQKEKIYAPVFTSRGCPFKCSYCHNIFGKTFRFRSAEHILKEIRLLYNKFGVREIHFIDDVFNLRKDRVKQICQGIIDSGMRIALAFPNGLRVDIMNEEILHVLKHAGTYKINYAIETVTPRLQSEIKKNINLDKAQRMIEITSKIGIITFGFFMIGFPTETREEIKNTIDFAVNSRLDTAKFFKVTPYKGTELGDYALQRNPGLGDIDLKHFTFYDTSSSVCKEVGGEELERLIKEAYRRFYKKPSRVWRILKKYPGFLYPIKKLRVIYQYADQ